MSETSTVDIITADSDPALVEPGDGGEDMSSRSLPYVRSYPLEDISIRAGGDGRTVDAYAAIFKTPTEIHDEDGDYMEQLDTHCFDRAIEFARSAKGGWNIPVMYNHGMTIWRTPSPQDSMPIGVPLEIRADSKGLFTRTRYLDTPRADEALENIKAGSISAYSFAGKFHRSTPVVTRRGYRADAAGRLPLVTRTASTLREYGPTPFPAYAGAEIVGVRAEAIAAVLTHMTPDERHRLADLISGDSPETLGTPEEGPATADNDPPPWHSDRSAKEQMLANRARFIIAHGGI